MNNAAGFVRGIVLLYYCAVTLALQGLGQTSLVLLLCNKLSAVLQRLRTPAPCSHSLTVLCSQDCLSRRGLFFRSDTLYSLSRDLCVADQWSRLSIFPNTLNIFIIQKEIKSVPEMFIIFE